MFESIHSAGNILLGKESFMRIVMRDSLLQHNPRVWAEIHRDRSPFSGFTTAYYVHSISYYAITWCRETAKVGLFGIDHLCTLSRCHKLYLVFGFCMATILVHRNKLDENLDLPYGPPARGKYEIKYDQFVLWYGVASHDEYASWASRKLTRKHAFFSISPTTHILCSKI